MARLLLLIAVAFTPSVVAADIGVVVAKQPELGCEIIDRGLYVPASQRVRYADPSSVTGERFEISQVRFVRQTTTIEATLGQRFGMRYRLRGLPQRAVVITWRVAYPQSVRGRKSWELRFRASPDNGELVQHLLYDFVYQSEVVTGRWDFQVLVDGQPACSLAFRVE
ncbi:MAG TPA: DUF3859 domain-containing protein [Kofleriaceae bacterium]